MIYDITMSKTQFSQLDTLNRITNHLIMSSNSIQDIISVPLKWDELNN